MAFLANYPIALAPGMGLNAYFAYTVVRGMKFPWQVALGCVFISGVLFFISACCRSANGSSTPSRSSLKMAIAAGIGLFLALIALKNAGIVVAASGDPGDARRPQELAGRDGGAGLRR